MRGARSALAEQPSLAAVLVETERLALSVRTSALAIWMFLVVAYATAELTLVWEVLGFAFLVLGLISLYLQLFLTAAALSGALPDFHFDRSNPTKGRLPSMVLLWILWLFGVTGGLLLLIIPGLILLVRWNLSAPVLLAEDSTATQSLRRSWELTRRHWKVTTATLVIGLAPLVPAFAISFQYPDDGPPTIAMALASNMLFATASVLSWLLICALYALITSPKPRLTA